MIVLHLFLWHLVVFQTKSDVIRHRCADELIVGILKHDADLITDVIDALFGELDPIAR